MAETSFPVHPGSRTSGVDGASEGGRIDTNNVPGALVLYGVSLLDRLRGRGYEGQATVLPERIDGIWCLKMIFSGPPPKEIPPLWHGHRVVVAKLPPAKEGAGG